MVHFLTLYLAPFRSDLEATTKCEDPSFIRPKFYTRAGYDSPDDILVQDI